MQSLINWFRKVPSGQRLPLEIIDIIAEYAPNGREVGYGVHKHCVTDADDVLDDRTHWFHRYGLVDESWEWLSASFLDDAVRLCIKNPDKVDWDRFSSNEHSMAVAFCIANPQKIVWRGFSCNENDEAVGYCLANVDHVDWLEFSRNHNDLAVKYLVAHPNEIRWYVFSSNANDRAVEYMLVHKDKIIWWAFSANCNDKAVDLLLGDARIDMEWLSYNTNDRAIDYAISHGVHWSNFQRNHNEKAVKHCLRNPDKVDWDVFRRNGGLYVPSTKFKKFLADII